MSEESFREHPLPSKNLIGDLATDLFLADKRKKISY